MAPPQPPVQSALTSPSVLSYDSVAEGDAAAGAEVESPQQHSVKHVTMDIVTAGISPRSEPHLGPDQPPWLGSRTSVGMKQSFYENHYNRRWNNFMDISFKTWEEMKWQAHLERSLFRHEWRWIVGILAAEYLNLVMHNLVYWIEGQVWKETGIPPPLKDAGIMLLGGLLPQSYDWLPGLFLYFLIGMVLTLCVGRQVLNNVPWGCPQVELFKRTRTATKCTNIPVPFVFLCKRACYALSIALLLRVCTYMVTYVPNPAYYCHEPYFNPPSAWHEIMGRIEVTGSCGDLLFSSHTTHAMIMTLMTLRNAPNLYPIVAIALFSMAGLVASLLIFKDHYSHDILVASYTCIMLWKLLHYVEPQNIDCDKYGIDFPVAPQFADTRRATRRRSVMVSRLDINR